MCRSTNETAFPVMIFSRRPVSSSRSTGRFFRGMTYPMTINFCRVPPESRFFKRTQGKMKTFRTSNISLFSFLI